MTAEHSRDSVAGAVGLPISLVALGLAVIPPVAFYVAWLPGLAGLVLGIVGIVRSRASTARRIAMAAVGIALASFAISGGWFVLGWLISNVFVECLAPTCR